MIHLGFHEILLFFLEATNMLPSAQATNMKTQIFQNIIENEAKTGKRKGEGDEVTSVDTSIRELKTNVTISKDKRATKTSHPVPLKNYATGQISYDTLHASEEADQVSYYNIK